MEDNKKKTNKKGNTIKNPFSMFVLRPVTHNYLLRWFGLKR